MNQVKDFILHIPHNVYEDIIGYRGKLDRFKAGHMTPMAFKAYRVPMGIYEQRQSGMYMVRIRVGAGLIRDFQFERVAQLSKSYGDGIVHITTRQDVQIHNIALEHTADVLESLLEVGLVSRGGGGNTVRNITACPRCGICPNEVFDVGPYSIAMAEYLLVFTSSYHLPRKFKIVFSGCPADCAFASVADLGFFANIHEGKHGFVVYGGGGLGPNARTAILLDEFVAADKIFIVAEALKRVFDKHGDRQNRNRARLRYVLDRLGENEFRKLYRKEKVLVEQESNGVFPEIRLIQPSSFCPSTSPPVLNESITLPPNASLEKKAGFVTLTVQLDHGDIPADDAIKIASVAKTYGSGYIRTSQLQDILIPSIPVNNITNVNEMLGQLAIDVVNHRPKIVTCTGAATCKLGLCLSRRLADKIASQLAHHKVPNAAGKLSLRISGCPNSCGGHLLADIGLEGKAKRIHGRLMPFYEVYAGATIGQGKTQLATRLGSVPAKCVPALIAEIANIDLKDFKKLRESVHTYAHITKECPESYFFDYGASEPFSLAGRGPGECGAGVIDVVRYDIKQAKDFVQTAVKNKSTKESGQALYDAIVSAARSLLILFAIEPENDVQIFRAFQENLIQPGWFEPDTQALLDTALEWKLNQRKSVCDVLERLQPFIQRIEILFESLDANLKFRVDPIIIKNAGNHSQSKTAIKANDYKIDLRGVACPLNFVKAKLVLEALPITSVLEVLLDGGEPIENLPASFKEQGQDILEIISVEDYYSLKVCRVK